MATKQCTINLWHRLALTSMLGLASATAYAEHESPLFKLMPPEDQEAVRSEKSVTIGIPVVNPYNLPGQIQWRPTGRFAIGLSEGAAVLTGSNDLGGGYILHPDQNSGAAYLQYYPIKSSGFYLGLGAEERFGNFSVHKVTDNSDDETARGSYSAVYGGPAFGMNWIWSSGFTLGFDVSKRKRFSGKLDFASSAAGNPSALGGEIQAQVTPDIVLGTFMLGFAF